MKLWSWFNKSTEKLVVLTISQKNIPTQFTKRFQDNSVQIFFIKFSNEQVSLELMFKELNPLAAILHAYAGGLIFMK